MSARPLPAVHQRIFLIPKEKADTFRVYEIASTDDGEIGEPMAERLARTFFIDPVTERFEFQPPDAAPPLKACIVWYKDGVYDAEGDMALYAIRRLGLAQGIAKIKFGRGHWLKEIPPGLFNPLVERLQMP
ncbi:MAG: hypothetical protein AAB091_07560 [Elusimicrobiota bacterium]